MITVDDLAPDEQRPADQPDVRDPRSRGRRGAARSSTPAPGPTRASAASTSTARSRLLLGLPQPPRLLAAPRAPARELRQVPPRSGSPAKGDLRGVEAWRGLSRLERGHESRREAWVLGEDYAAAPTCATCHMSGHTRNGGKITHDPGERISWTNRPPVSLWMDTDENHDDRQGDRPDKRRALITTPWEDKRTRMKDVCSHCHTPDYVNAFYAAVRRPRDPLQREVRQAGSRRSWPRWSTAACARRPNSTRRSSGPGSTCGTTRAAARAMVHR